MVHAALLLHAIVVQGNVLTMKKKLPKNRPAGGKEGNVPDRTGRNVVVESANVLKVNARRMQTRLTKRRHVHTVRIVETLQDQFVEIKNALLKPRQKIPQILPARPRNKIANEEQPALTCAVRA